MKQTFWLMIALVWLSSCGANRTENLLSGIDAAGFEADVNGELTHLYVLRNDSGMEVCVSNFGGRIVSIVVPDRNGAMLDVVLGFDSIADYIKYPTDFGATIGRYANRIAGGKFELDGVSYQLPTNNFGHCLHGGPDGWQYRVFDAVQMDDQTVELSCVSADGDANFPGTMEVKVRMRLTEENAIDIEYEATTDRPTIVNMTNHSYFNLSGNPGQPITDHLLWVDADTFTPVDSTFMTTGAVLSVEGTPMDFRVKKVVGADIDKYDYVQLKYGNGYDHNWVLNSSGQIDRPAATLYSPLSGIKLTVFTSEPGIQVYSGNFLDGSLTGKGGVVYNQRAGICLETQHYPDSPNKEGWPSVTLRPGETYKSRCIYRFTAE